MKNLIYDPAFWGGVCLVLVVLAARFAVEYQHVKLYDKIIERARKICTKEQFSEIEAILDKMTGMQMRLLCSLDDEEFQQEISAMLLGV